MKREGNARRNGGRVSEAERVVFLRVRPHLRIVVDHPVREHHRRPLRPVTTESSSLHAKAVSHLRNDAPVAQSEVTHGLTRGAERTDGHAKCLAHAHLQVRHPRQRLVRHVRTVKAFSCHREDREREREMQASKAGEKRSEHPSEAMMARCSSRTLVSTSGRLRMS